jgi:hypothetical protein
MSRGNLGRITFDNSTFEKLIMGETLTLDVRPDTTKLEIKLDPESKYHMTYLDLLSEAQKQLKLAPNRRI